MNKLCCCADPEVPSIALNVTCACFESHVEVKRDSPDLTTAEEEVEKIQEVEEKEDTVCCCCFRRKRQANGEKRHKRDGSKA